MSFPSDRRYAKTHEWFRASGDTVTVGITRYAADELTDITFVDLPEPGTRVVPGEPFGEIESVKATSELISPVAGEIVEVNAALADAPELVNDEPHENGWMVRIKVDDPAQLDGLLDAAAYESHCAAAAE